MKLRVTAFVWAASLLASRVGFADESPAPAPASPLPPPAASPLPSLLPSSPSEPPLAQGWLAVQERNAFGIPNGNARGTTTNDYGADLLGGAWLLDRQLQPIADVGWSRVFWPNQPSLVDTFRIGGKVAGGYALTDDLWLGATVGILVEAGWKHEVGIPLAWAATPSVTVLLQEQIARRLLLGVETGLERALPNLKWDDGTSIYNKVRFQLGVQLGVVLGPTRSPATPSP